MSYEKKSSGYCPKMSVKLAAYRVSEQSWCKGFQLLIGSSGNENRSI